MTAFANTDALRNHALAIVFLCCLNIESLHGQKATDAEQSSVSQLLDKSILNFRLVSKGNEQQTAKCLPVLRWTNDVRDSHSVGLLSLWVQQGRPTAVLGTYVWQGKLMHEFDSISRTPFEVLEGDAMAWEPKEQVDFAPIPNQIPVEKNPLGRMRQMKSIASKFSITMLGWRRDYSDKEQLRLLPRELFRYTSENKDCVDGAIFAFVLGTDPEALLVLEAIDRNGTNEWQYALVRQTSAGLDAIYDGASIWQVRPHPPRSDRRGLGYTSKSETSVP